MTEDTPYRLHQSLGYQLSLTSRIQERRLEENLRRLGLSRATWCALLAVGNEGLSKPSEIAEFVGVDRTATSRALRQMEEAGLIERKNGAGDRRTTTVALTGKGRDMLRQGSPFARANNQVYHDKLTDAECTELRRLLAKLREGEQTALNRL